MSDQRVPPRFLSSTAADVRANALTRVWNSVGVHSTIPGGQMRLECESIPELSPRNPGVGLSRQQRFHPVWLRPRPTCRKRTTDPAEANPFMLN